jgi:predicted lipoprotein with Yx(FWY)xxD motif
MKNKIMFSTLLVLMLVTSACGSAAPTALPVVSTAVPPATSVIPTDTAVPPAMSSSSAVLVAGQNAALGSFLVDSKGMTLYLYTKDTPGTSNCYGSCASYWPPLLTNGAPVAGQGVTASMLGTTTRTDGSVQVTYNGWPLYYFANDKVAGDTTGEGSQSVWYVITPDGLQK